MGNDRSIRLSARLQYAEQRIRTVEDRPLREKMAAVNAYINLDCYILDDVFTQQYLKPCGFDSLEDVYWFDDWERIIAECIFEVDAPLFAKSMVGTRSECIDYICLATGLDLDVLEEELR